MKLETLTQKEYSYRVTESMVSLLTKFQRIPTTDYAKHDQEISIAVDAVMWVNPDNRTSEWRMAALEGIGLASRIWSERYRATVKMDMKEGTHVPHS